MIETKLQAMMINLKRKISLAAAPTRLWFQKPLAAQHHRRNLLKRRTLELEKQGKTSSFNKMQANLSLIQL